METQIFKSYLDFLTREDKKINGVSEEFAKDNPDFIEQNKTNEACWNCSDCSDCSCCSDCSRCSRCSRCSGCSDCSDCSRCSDCSGCSRCSDIKNARPVEETGVSYPIIENIHQKILEVVSNPEALDMSDWHTDTSKNEEGAYCGTTHCRAGWAVVLAGKEGVELEKKTSTLFAAMMIYRASSPDIKVSPPRFFESNEIAMADIKRCAELEVANKHD